ncbi:membrane cofactor protein-like isoform X2 [Vanacampus margaritifer]
MDVSSLFLLPFYLGLAVVAQAQDCSSPTLGANMNLKGDDILKDTFPDGSEAALACAVGYTPKFGARFITCTAGVWSPVTLECERIYCEAPLPVTNGKFDFSGGSQFGDILSISCLKGYIIVGNTQQTCLANGKWSGHPPSCEVVICKPPQQLAEGSFSPIEDNYKYRDVVRYTCKKDYVLDGSKTASCSHDGNFTPDPPVCVKVKCPEFNILNAEVISGGRPPYEHMEFVTFQCNSGFEMIGYPTVTCQINSQWSPEPPTCQPTPKPDDKSGSGNHLGMYLGITLAVFLGLVAIILVGCYYCGGLAFIKKKRKTGYRKGRSNDEAAKDGEGEVRKHRTPAGTLLEMG